MHTRVSIPVRFSTVNTILSILYYCVPLYFQPAQNVSSADSLWSLFNEDDKQLKNRILIGCNNEKTYNKHAIFCISTTP